MTCNEWHKINNASFLSKDKMISRLKPFYIILIECDFIRNEEQLQETVKSPETQQLRNPTAVVKQHSQTTKEKQTRNTKGPLLKCSNGHKQTKTATLWDETIFIFYGKKK